MPSPIPVTKVATYKLDWRSSNSLIASQVTTINEFLNTKKYYGMAISSGLNDEVIMITYSNIPIGDSSSRVNLYVKKTYDEVTGIPIADIDTIINTELADVVIVEPIVRDGVAIIAHEV